MTAILRPLDPETELVRYTEIRHHAYHMPFDGQAIHPHLLNASETRCVFVDGVMQATGRLIPYKHTLHGQTVPMGGVASIAVPMEERGKGHVRQILTHMFAELRDRRVPVSTLYTPIQPLYRSYGYELIAEQRQVRIPIQELQFDCPVSAAGEVAPMREADIPAVKALYERYRQRVNGMLQRTDEQWQNRVLTAPLLHGVLTRRGWLWRDAQGEAQGYMLWDSIDDGTLEIHEMVALSSAAEIGLLEFLHRDNLLKEVVWPTYLDNPLVLLQRYPKKVKTQIEPGFMARIVDVQAAWEIISPDAADGRVVLEVQDSRCDWNQGRFALTVEGGRARVERTTEDAQASAEIRLWTQLLYGALNVQQALYLGTLQVHDQHVLPFLQRLWATPHKPQMLDRF
jgi:predicted acetyltransferase